MRLCIQQSDWEAIPRFGRMAEITERQRLEVQEVFQFMVAVAMEESGIAELMKTSQFDGRTWYSGKSSSGEAACVYTVGVWRKDECAVPIEQTLEKVEQDIASGDYGKARDRLHGLVSTYPDALSLRRRLGEIYWELRYPAMAGRYWYLEEDTSPDMLAACEAFEQSCGNSSLQILLSLKFQGDVESIHSESAKDKLLTLQSRVRDQHGLVIEFGKKGTEKYQGTERSATTGRALLVGFAAVSVLAIVLALIGLSTVIRWLF